MTLDEKLKLIGFSDFIHLNIKERDGLKRLTYTGYFKGNIFSIRLVYIGSSWHIDLFDDNNVICGTLKTTKEEINMNKLIYFFKNYYFKKPLSDKL
jgi:hypothetical protein